MFLKELHLFELETAWVAAKGIPMYMKWDRYYGDTACDVPLIHILKS